MDSKVPKRYNRVNNKRRSDLIDKVFKILIKVVNQGFLLKDAASMLKINYSTAKTILRVYRNENRVGRKYKCNEIQRTLPPAELLQNYDLMKEIKDTHDNKQSFTESSSKLVNSVYEKNSEKHISNKGNDPSITIIQNVQLEFNHTSASSESSPRSRNLLYDLY
jgi:hypothetical protein